MNTKEEFEQGLRKWALLDNKIRASSAELKSWRSERDTVESHVCNYMRDNKLNTKKIDTGDSVITFCEQNDYQGLTYGYVEKCLGEIIADKDHVKHIMNYLKSKREITKSTGLRRTFKKTGSSENI